jgi:ubiquinone/menaquinone biosynthesis C-methylase UbiE
MLSVVERGDRVLDVGCGPGTFAIECARRGASVGAVDINPEMLYAGELAAKREKLEGNVNFQQKGATELDFKPASFDVVVFSLSMSELRDVEQRVAVNSAFDLLRPGGKLVVADEVVPEGLARKLWYHLRRTLLLAITFIITRATTRPVREIEEKFRSGGFDIERTEQYERGSLKLVVGARREARPAPEVLSAFRLSAWAEALGEVYSYLTLSFKAVPMRTGLYRVGAPGKDSPVLVTANFLLTFTQLRKHLRGIDCYVLVIDSRGINVWCAAGKGAFSAEEIANSLRATRAGEIVETRKLILPKLAANGVKYRNVRRLTGWDAVFGPVYARDLPEYLHGGCVASEGMKRVRFDLVDRSWVAPPFALFVAFGFLAPLLVLRDLYSPMIPAIALAAGLIFPVAFYILPTSLFFKKGLTLGLIGALAAGAILLTGGAPAKEIVQWTLIIVGITLFVAMDFSGMSPVSNYSRIREEYYVAAPLLGLIIAGYAAVSFFWR